MTEILFIAIFMILFSTFYLYRTLSVSFQSDFKDNSIEAFIVKGDGKPVLKKKRKHKYKKDYKTEGKQVLILYGTEYGCSEEIARLLYDRISELSVQDEFPFQPRVINMKNYNILDFSKEQVCFVIVSTSGDGVPPADAKACYDYIQDNNLDLSHLKIALLALGDSNYPQFCLTGRSLYKSYYGEAGTPNHGFLVFVTPVLPLHPYQASSCSSHIEVSQQDVDMEDWSVINKWLDDVVSYLQTADLNVTLDYLQHENILEENYSRNKPFMATLKRKYLLTVCDSIDDKETIHCEFDLTGSGLNWTSGDALGIYPENSPEEVQRLLQAMKYDGTQHCDIPPTVYETDNQYCKENTTLSTILQKYYDLKYVKRELLELLLRNVENNSEQEKLAQLLNPEVNNDKTSDLQIYLHSKEVVDVLLDFPSHTLSQRDILACLKYLQPRYYSISSSPLIDNDTACVTAAVVRYTLGGYKRTGVTTTYLQDRLAIGQKCPVFISRNLDFRLPEDVNVPLILIGPGTGIAPFIAFIQERILHSNGGHINLYFGCRHKEKDFLYRSYLEDLAKNSKIILKVAFSRDQPEKVYVQHLLYRDKELIWHLINKHNACVYVCGDAESMAGDVNRTLLKIVLEMGMKSDIEAKSFLKTMERDRRYQKDVWVV